MASRTRKSSGRSRPRSQSTSGQLWESLQLPPHIARSLFGLVLIVLGAVTLIALLFPTAILNRYVADALLPLFGSGAWLLAILLIVAGIAVERPGTLGYGSSLTILGGLVVFVAGLGLLHLVWGHGSSNAALREGGGVLGHTLSRGLADLLSPIGAFVVLTGLLVGGLLLLFNITLRTLLTPVAGGGKMIAKAMATPARALAESASARRAESVATAAPPTNQRTRAEKPEKAPREVPVKPALPAPESQAAPLSQTIWSAQLNGVSATAAEPVAARAADETEDAETPARVWTMPAYDLLSAESAGNGTGQRLDHARNIQIIEEKLASFQIAADVVATNTGPVVTQYEVKPDANVKLSRIEGLADDLAMALAARSIRIEAPIPGRDVVGIEIPNHNSEVVGFRRLLEDAGMSDATSKLTFALGRDVSGKAYAVDLGRMPHLLIAGATGSGKSVCVNALIGSLLMRATPDEVRLILVDLKRVELAAYRDLPHLETPVIVESHEARAVLTNLVHEMEHRYELLAEAMERNLAAFNVSPRRIGKPMPYMVVVIDELADLILREGRKVEDPIVKIAQKARAVGIHLVLATQRPSVNVVTGLIKANVPSRIAFAMASNVDSRTVLDAPGAEDLIGRGDMLYQPADLPRPVRLQGVFVSDPEIRAVADFWRDQAEPTYNRDLLAGAEVEDGGDGGQFGWLAKGTDDELVPRAAELIMQTGRASTSMLQTKLKVGFNRATRIIDELEKHGIIGPLDTRNPGAPRTVYGPENWIRDAAEANADLD
jgi:DNA segregation ATPase FtsK/SpoIIIE, S-DNA-T family